MVVDLWGRCATCHKWFDCAGWFDDELPEPHCPSCGGDPVEILNRAGDLGMRVVVTD